MGFELRGGTPQQMADLLIQVKEEQDPADWKNNENPHRCWCSITQDHEEEKADEQGKQAILKKLKRWIDDPAAAKLEEERERAKRDEEAEQVKVEAEEKLADEAENDADSAASDEEKKLDRDEHPLLKESGNGECQQQCSFECHKRGATTTLGVPGVDCAPGFASDKPRGTL